MNKNPIMLPLEPNHRRVMGSHPGRQVFVQGAVRIDRWLLAARVFKTRTLAANACASGRVELGGARVKPHRLVRVGDRVEVNTPRGRRLLTIMALAAKRLPAPAAKQLYLEETSFEPRPRRQSAPAGKREPGSGRPTKRERRAIERLRRG